jgi:hypothetical protein
MNNHHPRYTAALTPYFSTAYFNSGGTVDLLNYFGATSGAMQGSSLSPPVVTGEWI